MRDMRAEALAGALAGAAGTLAMTVAMKPGLVGYLPPDKRPREFVPKKIVRRAEQAAGQPQLLTEEQEMAAALLAHLGYGTSMGAVYGLVRPHVRQIPAPVAGGLYGLLLWGFGYEGWMPALGIQRATTEKPPKKWPLPILNHLIYGVTTALVYERLR